MPAVADLRRTMIATIAVAAAAWLYGITVAPWLEGGPRIRPSLLTETSSETTDDEEVDPDLVALFPEGSWELEAAKRLEVDQGRAFFRDYLPTEQGDLEVKPFTIVLESPEGDGQEGVPPLILRAPQGALLTFDQPVSLGFHKTGKLERAVLRGEVMIDRAAGPDVEPLSLVTHNVQWQDDRIFTPHDVLFRLGDHQGEGQNLMIRLLTEPRAGSDAPVPAIRGVRSIELVRLARLRLAVPPEATAPGTGVVERSGDPSSLGSVSWLDVACAGSFHFDLPSMQATLRHDVLLTHHRGDPLRPLESLAADRMTVRFTRVLGQRRPSAYGSLASQPPSPAELRVREVLAVGAPAVLDSPARRLRAEASLLAFDPIDRRIRLQDERRVLLQHDGFEFEAPSLEYDIDDARRLGRARSVGAGRLSRAASGKIEALEVRWNEEMLLRPHDGLDALSLYGSPSLTMGSESRFDARELHLWIREVPASAADRTAGERRDERRSELQPDKMLAEGEVRIDSPQLAGSTDRLEVFWGEAGGSVAAGGANAAGNPNSGSNGRGASGGAAPVPAGGLQLSTSSGSGTDRRRMNVAGTYVRARMIPSGRTYEVEEITIEGEASLVEESTDPSAAPLAIRGRVLKVESVGGGLFSAYVVSEASEGQATLAARGLELFGTRLQLDQRTHRMWSDGPGEARLRPPADSSGAGRLEGPAVVDWNGGIEFDGQVVRVRDQVVIVVRSRSREGNLSIIEIRGDALDMTLTRRIDLRQPDGGDGGEIDIRSLAFIGPVAMTHWENSADGRPRSIDRFRVRDVSIDYASGDLSAIGPGLGESIRAGSAAPGPAGTPGPSAELRMVRVEFAERVEGNLYGRKMAFVREVDVVSDVVNHWDDWRERAALAAGSDAIAMRGDRLETNWIEIDRRTPGTWEIALTGNAYAGARSFDASAARLVYVQGKDLMILEGNAREDAELTWARPNAPRRDFARARKIMYWRTDGRIEVDDLSTIDATFSGRIDGASRTPSAPIPRR